MNYYSERHGLRSPIEKTETITPEMYSLLYACCEKYYDNIAWLFPEECPDGNGCCGLDYSTFDTTMRYEIPTLFRKDNGRIAVPTTSTWDFIPNDEYDQYALLDFIEFFAANVRDTDQLNFHKYYGHYHLRLYESNLVFRTFRDEINHIFERTGLLFVLTEKGSIERVVDNGILSREIEAQIERVSEKGLRDLLKDALALFKTPVPKARQDAVEKIWDALERLKTYYSNLDKKKSAEKIVNDMSNGEPNFFNLFNDEFRKLTEIGNNFRIRHHETNKVDIVDARHYDYLFNRCLSLIALSIQYLR